MNGIPDMLRSSSGASFLPRAPHQPARYAGATYHVFTSTGKIASSLCEHRHAKETQAILCAQRLAKSIGGIRGQVCIKCQTIFDGTRSDAAVARWEPYSHDSTEAVTYGPLICPGCVARLLDNIITQLTTSPLPLEEDVR